MELRGRAVVLMGISTQRGEIIQRWVSSEMLRYIAFETHQQNQSQTGGCGKNLKHPKTQHLNLNLFKKKQQNLENNFVSLVILLMEEIQRSPVDIVVYPIIYRVLYISGGCLGILNHQQYVSSSYAATVRSWPSCGLRNHG